MTWVALVSLERSVSVLRIEARNRVTASMSIPEILSDGNGVCPPYRVLSLDRVTPERADEVMQGMMGVMLRE